MKRWLLPLLGAALLAGCTISAVKLGYRQADTLLAWRVNEYFDLDGSQKHEFNARLEPLLQWHRYEQLPEYAVFLGAVRDRIQPGLKRDDMVWIVDGVKERYRRIVERGVGDAADLLATITPEQIGTLQKQWAKDNRKFAKEHELNGTPEARRKARLKRTVDQIEDWAGNLSAEQQRQIAQLVEQIPHIHHLRYKDRIRRQQEFAELLKIRANKKEFQPRLRAYLLDWERGRSPEYDRLADEVYERRMQFYVAVEKLLTPAQRQHVMQRIQRLIEDCRTLSQRS
jgi:hypothetical protein